MTYIDSRILTSDMMSAYGRRCIRAEHSCIPNYFHLNYRLEADLLCIDDIGVIHEIEVKATYADFTQEKYKSEKYKLMLGGLLDCNTFSYLVPQSICERIIKESDSRFGVYCYYHENTKKKRIICKRKPEIIDNKQKGLSVFNNILRKSTLITWG